jgi:hypothetical protein
MPLSTNFYLYRGGQPTFPGNNILSTNINKQNNHISFKIIKYKKIPQNLALEIHFLAWDRHKYVAGSNRLTSFDCK